MIERHHDYVVNNVTLASGQTQVFTILLDQDAPFALRSIVTGATLSRFQFLIEGPDGRRYASATKQNPQDSLLNPGTFFPVYPQITFPAYGAITLTLNDLSGGGTGPPNAIALRGVKLFQEGQVFAPQYPAKFTELMFRYKYQFTLAQGTLSNPTVLTSQPLNILNDADFVVRMGSAYVVLPSTDGWDVIACVLRDQYGRAYSTDSTGPGATPWIPAHFLFPVPGFENCVWPDTTLYPEIYVPRNSQLLMDIQRSSGTASNTLQFVLHGSKIFPL
jgi:hypothetical protein